MRRIALFFFSLLLNPSIFIKDTGLTCARSIFFKYYQSLQWAPYDNIITRFNAPRGYHQMAVGQESFACYLQHLPLKPMFSRTTTYNGDFARTDAYTSAVVAMDIGTKNLQQCAGTVIRLRAEYLFRQKNSAKLSSILKTTLCAAIRNMQTVTVIIMGNGY